jgi:hypothetical protein
MKNSVKLAVAGAVLSAVATVAFAADFTGVSVGLNQYEASGSVAVSATVAPVLTMSLSGQTVAFNTLSLGTPTTSADTTDVSVVTNANLGYSVVATFANLTNTANAAHTIPLKVISSAIGAGDLSSTSSVLLNTGVTPASGTPETTSVSYKATPAANQAAGSYTTSVVYTATANF